MLVKNKKIRIVIGYLAYISFIVAVVVGTPKLLSFLLKTEYPLAAITSGSMWPKLKTGDLILIEGIDSSDINVGDIVVFVNDEKNFTIHRVIELNDNSIITKGDANNIPDQPVPYEMVVGKLLRINNVDVKLPKLGYLSQSFNRLWAN
ncbi:signal peptidase I [Candidatus Parcubacteria bacterium]|nr:MAG: signal peptidase I [Candidatus Parcubacteria bacterium]